MALSTDNWINLISGLGGAVIGGCLGGAISFFLARQASRETLKRDAATRLTDLRMAALTFVTKLIQLANGLYTLSSTIEGSIDAARKEGNDGMLLWQKVKPRLGSITPPHFEALDFRAFSGIASGSMILNQTLLLEQRYASLATSFQEYCRLHIALQEFGIEHARLIGDSGVIEALIPPNLQAQYRIKSEALNGLIEDIRQNVAIDLTEAISLCDTVSATLQKAYPNQNFPTLENSLNSEASARQEA